jgi:hypothetical protein
LGCYSTLTVRKVRVPAVCTSVIDPPLWVGSDPSGDIDRVAGCAIGLSRGPVIHRCI